MMIRRVALAAAVAIGLLAAPLAIDAQQPRKPYRIGYLETGVVRPLPWEAFRERLRELGYVEGQTVAFELRWADGQLDRLPTLSAELVRLKVDVIVTAGSPAARAAKNATTSIPIVMATGGDPVGLGLVATLARPGGNVTGLTTLSRELSGKRLEMLREAFPRVARMGMLWHRTSDIDALTRRETEEAAQTLGISLKAHGVDGPDDFDRALSAIGADRAGAVLVATSPMFFGHRRQLADLALKHRLPTIFAFREYAEAGGLMAYGPSYTELFQRAAGYVDRILKGARPGDLPVECYPDRWADGPRVDDPSDGAAAGGSGHRMTAVQRSWVELSREASNFPLQRTAARGARSAAERQRSPARERLADQAQRDYSVGT